MRPPRHKFYQDYTKMGEKGFNFGWWLKQARADVGMTQKQLAALVGVSVRTVIYWERNVFKPAAWNISHLSTCLDCPSTDLFDLVEYGRTV